MRNRILLAVFFVVIAVMAIVYFVPQIDKPTNIDTLEACLQEAKKQIPESSDVYFFLENTESGPPEIYYKTQFLLAPRIVISTTPDKVPVGSYVLLVRDKSNPNINPALITSSELIVSTDAAFQIKLIKKL